MLTFDEIKKGIVKLKPYDKNNLDKHLVETFKSSNRVGFGADGVTVDGNGDFYTSIIENGVIYKTILDKKNNPLKTKLFAKSDNMTSAYWIVWDKSDNKIYIADFLGNAVRSVDMDGNVETLHENGYSDGNNGLLDEPCEVIVRGGELIIVNMDMPFENPHLVNTKIDKPYTLSVIK